MEVESADRVHEGVRALARFVAAHPRLFVLSGAGLSTASGIPGYRDAQGAWMRAPPVLFQDFMRSEAVRRRYWARSMAGWPVVDAARPNDGHRALARLQPGRIAGLVTQNVDGLHQRAGSDPVIELHGNLSRVVCIACAAEQSRAALQRQLEDDNPAFAALRATPAPDGDADVEAQATDAFVVPHCTRCSGILKPDVVFFGENVPRARVEGATAALDAADAMLVVGSSLMVYSGYRFCERAAATGKPIAAVNLGTTRADPLLSLKIEARCAEALAALVDALDR